MYERLFKDALIVLGISAYAYGLTISFEYGYITYFGIPYHFIEVTTTTLIVGGLILVIVLYAVLAMRLVFLNSEYFWLIGSMFLTISRYSFILLAAIPLYAPYLILRTFSIFDLLYLVGSLIAIINPLLLSYQVDQSIEKPTSAQVIERGLHTLVSIFTIVSVLYASILWGSAAAHDTEHFMKLSDTEAVLRVYNDKMIYAEYDTTTNTVSSNFGVVQIGNEPLNMTYEHIGELTAETD